MPHAPAPVRLTALADQCVMCGLCLPYCPTYAAGREEGESPRGRIALIKALAEDRLPATPELVEHLDSCLACRRCEAVCPAGVRYGELIAGARALPTLAERRPRWRRALERWLSRPRRLRGLLALRPLLAPTRSSWWRRTRGDWARRARLAASLPAPSAIPAARSFTSPASPPEIALFPGCVAEPYERELRAGALRLLAALGDTVAEADADLCCGSLARYGGDADEAAARERQLVERLRERGIRRLLGTATGCQARLAELLAPAGIEVAELHVHLAGHPALARLAFAPLPQRVAVHRPCSQRLLGARSADAVDRLLDCIPGLSRVDLPEQDRCCGAAGSQFLTRPAQAEPLRERVLTDVAAAAPDLLVSANIGCRLFITGGLAGSGLKLPVLHPVELLARQLIP